VTRMIRDARKVAKNMIWEMERLGDVTDPAGAEVWKWSAVDDYAQLLKDAPTLTAEQFEARQESVELYAAKAEAAGMSREWLDAQFFRVRREWALDNRL
jgi:hypothetical protein